MNRRELLNKMLLGGTTLIVAPGILQSCSKDESTDPANGGNNNNPPPAGTKITIDLTNPNYSSLNSVGGSIVIQSVLVANTGSGTYIALDSICTHNGCTVEYKHLDSNIQCPCHGSVFSKSGAVINGPAAVALKTYSVTKNGDIITVTLS